MATATDTHIRTVDGKTVPAPGVWTIDPAHTSVEFVGRHLMVTKVRGAFADVEGTINVADQVQDSSVDVSIKTASVSTGAADRDGHLVSPDFFDVETYPEMRFVSTSVEPAGDAWKLNGDLTIKGVSHPVALDFEFLGLVSDPWGNTKAAFSGSTEINREDWGLNWNVALDSGGVLVSKKISIELEIQATPAS